MRDERFDRKDMGDKIAPEHKSGAVCPHCYETVRVEEGVFRKHRRRSWDAEPCPGSGQTIPAETRRENVDHDWTGDIVCPWCGYPVQPDCGPEEWQGVNECGECNKPFDMDFEVNVNYRTQRIDPAVYAARIAMRKEAIRLEREKKKPKEA